MSIATKGIDVSVPFYLRPIGFLLQNNRESNLREIDKWQEREKPGFIKILRPSTVGSIVSMLAGIVSLITGFKKENNIWKWAGGVLSLFGIGSYFVTPWLLYKLYKKSTIEKENFFKEIDSFKGNQETVDKSINDLLESYDKTKIQAWLASLFCEKPEDFTPYKTAIKVLKAIGGNEVTKLLLDCVKNKNYPDEVRVDSLRALVEVADEEVINMTLLDCLKDKRNNSFIQREAASLLGKRKDPKLVTPLKDYLLNSGNNQNYTHDSYMVLQTVIGAISGIGGEEALKALKEINSKGILLSETQAEIDRLKKIYEPRCVDDLISAIDDEKNSLEIRLTVVERLAEWRRSDNHYSKSELFSTLELQKFDQRLDQEKALRALEKVVVEEEIFANDPEKRVQKAIDKLKKKLVEN